MKNVFIIALLALATIITSCNRNQAITETEAVTNVEEKAKPNADEQTEREKLREQARNVDPNNVAGEVLDFIDGRVTLTDDQRASVTKLAGKYDFANMSFQEQRQSARALRKEIKGMLSAEQLDELKNGKKTDKGN